MTEVLAEYVSGIPSEQRTNLTVVDNSDRPPKLTADEAADLLKRGPYLARLNAARRVLAICQAYDDDELTTELISDAYMTSLRDSVETHKKSLKAYDAASRRRRLNARKDAPVLVAVEPETTTALEPDVLVTPAPVALIKNQPPARNKSVQGVSARLGYVSARPRQPISQENWTHL